MDGNTIDEVNNLLTKTRQMTEYLRTSTINKKKAWYTFTAEFMKTPEYSMDIICLIRSQWDRVTSPLLSIVLQKSGITKVFSRTMIYSSIKYHGLGVFHPWRHQQIRHLQTLIDETANNTPTGKLLQVSTEQQRLGIGLTSTFKNVPWEQITDIITSTWMTKLLSFLGRHNIAIHDPLPQLELQREGDIFLMQCFLLTKPSNQELWRLNYFFHENEKYMFHKNKFFKIFVCEYYLEFLSHRSSSHTIGWCIFCFLFYVGIYCITIFFVYFEFYY